MEIMKTKHSLLNRLKKAPTSLKITPPIIEEPHTADSSTAVVSPGGPDFKSITTSMTLGRRNKKHGVMPKFMKTPEDLKLPLQLAPQTASVVADNESSRKDNKGKTHQRVCSAPLTTHEGVKAMNIKKKTVTKFSKISLLSSFFERKGAQPRADERNKLDKCGQERQ